MFVPNNTQLNVAFWTAVPSAALTFIGIIWWHWNEYD